MRIWQKLMAHFLDLLPLINATKLNDLVLDYFQRNVTQEISFDCVSNAADIYYIYVYYMVWSRFRSTVLNIRP